MVYVINWKWDGNTTAYVTKGQPNRKPYTTNPTQAQHWKTEAAAQRFLQAKDKGWAAKCVIEPYEPSVN